LFADVETQWNTANSVCQASGILLFKRKELALMELNFLRDENPIVDFFC